MNTQKLLILICAFLALKFVNAAEVMVAVASNFSAPMQKIAESFEKETGHKAVLVFGSTGGLYAQIKNGAPYQILLSADNETVDLLVRQGFAIDQTQFTYAVGRLILWSAKEGYVDESGGVLRANAFKKLAVANPKLAPYGLAALQTLTKLQLTDAVEPKLIIGENITQTYQFVLTQNVELGFLALSQVYRDGKLLKGSGWIVPAQMHEPIRQDAVVLKSGNASEGAKALMSYLKTDRVKAIIKSYGYTD